MDTDNFDDRRDEPRDGQRDGQHDGQHDGSPLDGQSDLQSERQDRDGGGAPVDPVDPHRIDEIVDHFRTIGRELESTDADDADDPSGDLWATRLPFAPRTETVHAEPDWVFASTSGDEAVSRLLYLAEQSRPAGLLRGRAGVGKTTALASVATELRRGGRPVLTLDLAGASHSDVLDRAAAQAGLAVRDDETATTSLRRLRRWIDGQLAVAGLTILVDHVDEADELAATAIDRLLGGCDSARVSPTLLAAAGGGPLPPLRWLSRHAALMVQLAPFDLDETRRFLNDGIAAVGGGGYVPRFTDEAAERLHAVSAGQARTLASIARMAFLAGRTERFAELTVDLVDSVLPELAVAA